MAAHTTKSQPRKNSHIKDTSQGRKRVNSTDNDASAKHILSDRTRRDIAGVIWILVGLVLFLIVLLAPQEGSVAMVAHAASEALHLVFGVGCYICPFFLIAIGITFLIRFEGERVSARVAIGLALIFVALLGFIAAFTPVRNIGVDDLSLLFSSLSLVSYGGYIGAGLAWAGLTLFGQLITCVILVGVMLIGVIIIGFSLSRLIEKIRLAALSGGDDDQSESNLVSLPNARILRKREKNVTPVQSAQFGSGGDTTLLVQPARPLTSNITRPIEDIRDNKRHRSNRDLNKISDVALTQKIESTYIPSNPQHAKKDDSRTTQMLPLTRKLGSTDKQSSDDASDIPENENIPVDESVAENNPDQLQFEGYDSVSTQVDTVAVPQPQEGFILPSPSLLKTNDINGSGSASDFELQETAERLQTTLEDFGIMAEVVGWVAGPTVTLFKINLPSGVRVSRVTALNDDIALALAAQGVRIFAPIPGTNYVGIEVPNRTRQNVLLSDVIADAPPGPLQIAIGKDVEGHSIVLDLAKMPHLLIGGTTGSGKSVSINAMIMSILMRATPSEVRFILIDPKRVEFTPYNGIPHLYVPVVTEPREAASALSWGVAEMERRLKVFSKVGARNIGLYNAKVQKAKAEQEKARQAGTEPEAWEYDDELPYIVIIIDELADLMMNVGKEVEFSISRIAQLARAAGIHLIVATQRPSTNVVTGLIKANITNRIAFNVASSIDSRVILDTPGAENLIGLGDMLLSRPEYGKPLRIQGCFVSEEEINAVVNVLKEQGEPEYHSEILSTNIMSIGSTSPDGNGGSSTDDPLVWDAADMVVSSGIGSTSNIQRRFKVGYSRAGRIMDQLEEKGIVGPSNGSKPREVLVDALDLETLKAFEEHDEEQSSSFTEE